jgi:RecG-like helicase
MGRQMYHIKSILLGFIVRLVDLSVKDSGDMVGGSQIGILPLYRRDIVVHSVLLFSFNSIMVEIIE